MTERYNAPSPFLGNNLSAPGTGYVGVCKTQPVPTLDSHWAQHPMGSLYESGITANSQQGDGTQ